MVRAIACVSISIGLAAAGCGDGASNVGGDDGPWGGADAGTGGPDCFSSSECPVGWTCSEFGTCVPPPPGVDASMQPPPEIEYDLTEPHSSQRYVWVAMTQHDRLAKIDGANLEVVSVPVGDRPEVLATLLGTDTAVVLDSVNAAATLIRPAQGSVSSDLYPTLPNLNRLATTPRGRYAVAFFQ